MKCLILGASGLLGKGIYDVCLNDTRFEVIPLLREGWKNHNKDLFKNAMYFTNVAAIEEVANIVDETMPDVVINCIGIVKSLIGKVSARDTFFINSIFPHELSRITQDKNIHLIHFSSDCVYSGAKGEYQEQDQVDTKDTYGRSKYYGEVKSSNSLVLRISVIGRELNSKRGLVDWFLDQTEVDGFTNAIFSGLPSVTIGNFLKEYLTIGELKNGLYHLSAEPISKYDLLTLINTRAAKNIKINAVDIPVLDRSLNSDLLRQEFSWAPRGWEQLVDEMFEEQYD
jgi:dTDP-4-dehydrorhamnose reductase